MFTSRTFIIFLIPVVILGLGVWTFMSTEVDRGDVRVAGALISKAEVELSVSSCYLTSAEGASKLVVELEARNVCSVGVNIDPGRFCVILARGNSLGQQASHRNVFAPIRHSSHCDEAPNSLTSVPPGAVRSITLIFWGETMPRGSEWGDYLLSLEYYDTATPLILSTVLSPTEQ